MNDADDISTAYELPFDVRYPPGLVFSHGGVLEFIAEVQHPGGNVDIVADVFGMFAELAATGALAGANLPPWTSGLQIASLPACTTEEMHVQCANCYVDERALVILAHLLLTRQHVALLRRLEVRGSNTESTITLRGNAARLSTYPERYRKLPFSLIDLRPESGAYTFTAQLKQPLRAQHRESLEYSLNVWARAILAGAYGLAPIPPRNSYVEPDSECVTSIETTIEWTVFKLRADPACLSGLINIFAAFHERCQEIVSLEIS